MYYLYLHIHLLAIAKLLDGCIFLHRVVLVLTCRNYSWKTSCVTHSPQDGCSLLGWTKYPHVRTVTIFTSQNFALEDTMLWFNPQPFVQVYSLLLSERLNKRVQLTSWYTVILWELVLFLEFLVEQFTSIGNVLLYVHCSLGRPIQCNLTLYYQYGVFKRVNCLKYSYSNIHWVGKAKSSWSGLCSSCRPLQTCQEEPRQEQAEHQVKINFNYVCIVSLWDRSLSNSIEDPDFFQEEQTNDQLNFEDSDLLQEEQT